MNDRRSSNVSVVASQLTKCFFVDRESGQEMARRSLFFHANRRTGEVEVFSTRKQGTGKNVAVKLKPPTSGDLFLRRHFLRLTRDVVVYP